MTFKHIFFDLDRTLWDFDTNSSETLRELHKEFSLHERGVDSIDEFIAHYKSINQYTWEQYRKNEIDKDYLRFIRFHNTLLRFNINDHEFAKRISAYYIFNCPKKVKLMPFAKELLDYLFSKYQLHIITNGFQDIQHHKIRSGEIGSYFKTITTSECVGHKKPGKEIFQFALDRAQANIEESIMIGDDLEADIKGASAYGMAQIYLNPEKKAHFEKPTFEIHSLFQLSGIL